MEAGFFIAHAQLKQKCNSIRKAKHCEKNENDVLMMSDGTKRIQAQESRGFPPVDYVRRWRNRAPIRFETLLHFKGFARGVPQNTERTTVKPWVGIAR